MHAKFTLSQVAFNIVAHLLPIFHDVSRADAFLALRTTVASVVPNNQVKAQVVVVIYPFSLIVQVFIVTSIWVAKENGRCFYMSLKFFIVCGKSRRGFNVHTIYKGTIKRCHPELLATILECQVSSH